MTRLPTLEVETDELQSSAWPPIYPFQAFPEGLNGFLLLPLQEQARFLVVLRSHAFEHAKFLQEGLACLYAYVLGYQDSPIHLITPDALERRLLSAKITLEREMIDHWLRPQAPPDLGNAQETVLYLQGLMSQNRGISHDLFTYVREATGSSLRLGGMMPVLSEINSAIFPKRQSDFEPPWFCKAISNSFRMLATRPGCKFRAYGAYLLNESQAGHHFQSLLKGLARNDHSHRDLIAHFASKERIHRDHLGEMLSALLHQKPKLTSDELWEISWGAHIAIASACKVYDQALNYFQGGPPTG